MRYSIAHNSVDRTLFRRSEDQSRQWFAHVIPPRASGNQSPTYARLRLGEYILCIDLRQRRFRGQKWPIRLSPSPCQFQGLMTSSYFVDQGRPQGVQIRRDKVNEGRKQVPYFLRGISSKQRTSYKIHSRTWSAKRRKIGSIGRFYSTDPMDTVLSCFKSANPSPLRCAG